MTLEEKLIRKILAISNWRATTDAYENEWRVAKLTVEYPSTSENAAAFTEEVLVEQFSLDLRSDFKVKQRNVWHEKESEIQATNSVTIILKPDIAEMILRSKNINEFFAQKRQQGNEEGEPGPVVEIVELDQDTSLSDVLRQGGTKKLTKRHTLNEQLIAAIENEDYEEAARLRDELQVLDERERDLRGRGQ